MSRPVRAAVVGCGDISVVHLEALAGLEKQQPTGQDQTGRPGVQLVGVCDVQPELAAAAGRDRAVPWFTDHRTMLAQVRPDVLHICTPHDQHVPVALDALAAGVHVLTEKPLAHTLAEAARFTAATEALTGPAADGRPGPKVGVCYQNRYNAPVQAMKQLLDSGRAGAVLGGHAFVVWHRTAAYYDARPWRAHRLTSGGGALINQAIHTVDLLSWLLGDVERVSGRVASHGLLDGEPDTGRDVEDTAHAVLDHAGGARSVFLATVAGVSDSPVTVEVVTERAVLALRGDLTVTWADGRVEQVGEESLPTTAGRSYWGTSHRRLIGDFYDRLAEPEPFWIGPREAMKSLAVLDSLYREGAGSS